jgi:CBS domain-containing protein
MKARDIMTPNPSVVTPQQPIAHAAEIMRELNVGIVPVVDGPSHMRLEGVLTDRDIAVRCVAFGHDGGCRVQDHMTADHLDVVREDADIAEVITKMETDQVRRIPVVADGGRLVGIIAQADLAVKLGPKDPMLVEEVLERISEPARADR